MTIEVKERKKRKKKKKEEEKLHNSDLIIIPATQIEPTTHLFRSIYLSCWCTLVSYLSKSNIKENLDTLL